MHARLQPACGVVSIALPDRQDVGVFNHTEKGSRSWNVATLAPARQANERLDINRAWFLLQFSDESIWVADMFKFPGLPVVNDFKRNNQERPGDKPEDAYDIPITAFINWTDTKKASEDA